LILVFKAPSSGLPFDKLRVGHLLPVGEKGKRGLATATSSPQRGEGGEAKPSRVRGFEFSL
jgi:hypothetical protein